MTESLIIAVNVHIDFQLKSDPGFTLKAPEIFAQNPDS